MKKPFLSLVILALIAPFAVASPRDDAAVALAIAKAKRTVTVKPSPEVAPVVAQKCFTDLSKAQDAAKRTGKQLIVWVGMECRDCPEVCEGLRDCVSCHAKSYNGSATPRLCIPVEGGAWCFPREKLGRDYGPDSVRSVLGKPIPSESRRVIQAFRSAADCVDGNCPTSR